MNDFLDAIGIRLASSFLGAVMALTFQPPKTWADFWTRGIFSIVAGVVFSDPVRQWLKWPETIEHQIASGAVTALFSWSVMAILVRVVNRWRPKE